MSVTTPQEFNAQLQAVLTLFLDQSRDIASEIGNSRSNKDDLKGPVLSLEERSRRATIEALILDLRDQVATQRKEGIAA